MTRVRVFKIRTIISRLLRVKELGSETVSDVQEAYRNIGIEILQDGEFLAFGDILDQLSKKWDTLGEETQRYLAFLTAGTRQQDTFLAIMNTYQDSIQLSADAMNNLSFATDKNQIFVESLDGRINLFTNSMQKLSHQLLDSDMFKNLVDTGTDLVETIAIIDDKFGLLNVGIGIATGALIVFKGEMIAVKSLKLVDFFSEVAMSIDRIGVASTASLLGINPFTLALGATVVAVGAGIASVVKYEKELRELIKTQRELTAELNQSAGITRSIDSLLESLEKAEEETQEYHDITVKLNALLPEASKKIDQENDSLAEQVRIYKELNELRKIENREKAIEVLANELSSMDQLNERIKEQTKQRDIDIKIRDEFLDQIEDTNNMTSLQSEKLQELNNNIKDHDESLDGLKARTRALATASLSLSGAYDDVNKRAEQGADLQEYWANRLEQSKNAEEQSISTSRQAQLLFVKTSSTIEKLTKDYDLLSDRKKREAREFINSEIEKTKELLKQAQARGKLYTELAKFALLEGVFDRAGAEKFADPALDLVDEYTFELNKLEQELENITTRFKETSTSSKTTTKALTEQEKAIKVLEESLKKLELQESLASDDISKQNQLRLEQIDVLQQLQAEVEENSVEWLQYQQQIQNVNKEIDDSLIDAQKKAEDALKATNTQLEKANKLLKEQASTLTDSVKNALQSEIDLLDSKKTSLENELSLLQQRRKEQEAEEKRLEKLKALEEARNKLRNIQNERNVRVFREGRGFVFEADPRAVRAQQEEVAKIEADIKKDEVAEARNAEEQKLKDRISALDKQKQAVKNTMSAISDVTSEELSKQNSYWSSWLESNSEVLGSFRNQIASTISAIQQLNSMQLGNQQTIDANERVVNPQSNTIEVLDTELNNRGSIHIDTFNDPQFRGRFQPLNQSIQSMSGLYNLPAMPKIVPSSSSSTSNSYSFGDLTLPNVTNGKSFVNELQQIARTRT